MKKSLLKIVSVFMIVMLCLPCVFATDLGTTSKIVKVGTVDTTDVVYDVDIEWGSLVYDFVKTEEAGQATYKWQAADIEDTRVVITNKSKALVNVDVLFSSNISGVSGYMNDTYSGMSACVYSLLQEEPSNWDTETFYQKEDGTYNFTEVEKGTSFEANKYYVPTGGGGGVFTSQLSGVTEDINNNIAISSALWSLELHGGSINEVKAGQMLGTLTVTLS